jgi:D-3-phosphoglycerate dehydrogenase / 2-oxoglutarate reductase
MAEGLKKKFTVVITGPDLAEPAMQELAESCRIINAEPYASSREIENIVRENRVDGLIVRMGRIDTGVIEASDSLKVIAKHGTGTDNIDKEAASRRKVLVMITPSANYESVAEHALGLMLAIGRGVVYLDDRMRQGHWDKSTYKGTELYGKTLGIVGYGRIGRRLSELVQPMAMNILVYDPLIKESGDATSVTLVNELEQLLKAADFVSLCCPLTPHTNNLIGAPQLKAMKNSALLVNTARGGVVDEKALETALESGEIAGAALDTFAQEPPQGVSSLARFDNVILTPHIGGVSQESFVKMGQQAVKNVLDVLESRPLDPACVVNTEIL